MEIAIDSARDSERATRVLPIGPKKRCDPFHIATCLTRVPGELNTKAKRDTKQTNRTLLLSDVSIVHNAGRRQPKKV